ncbi:MAG: 3'-5' exoribonuclease YhaM [Gemmatales bacterium]|nr:MAG: 3'-5' exoribonuclease YhaM [Gemmatales bacterium]
MKTLSQLQPGEVANGYVLLVERSRGSTREGKPYFTCRFRDAERTASVMVWADSVWFESCEKEWREGEFYKIEAVYGEHERYGPQLDLRALRPVNEEDYQRGFQPSAFLPSRRHDPAALFSELVGLVEGQIADEPLRRLVLALLNRHREAFVQRPASLRRFYPFPGGLVEHTLSVAKNCVFLAEKYREQFPELNPPLNKDLIIAGAALHDLGRVLEIDDDLFAPQQTIPGRFFGHLFLGRDMVRDMASEFGDVHPELLLMLEHIIVTHLTLPEWGSPRLPLIPEVIVLHHADDLDAKMEMYVRCLTEDKADGPFTDREPGLNRQLFKGRTV